jgi:type IV pilus assembly protein PilO
MNKKLLIQLLISMLVSIIIIVGSVYLFNEEPKQNTEEILAKTQEEIKTLQNKIQELKSRDNSSEIEAQIRALKQDVLQATYSFPKDLASSRLLRELSTIGDTSGVQVLLFEPLSPVSEGLYEEIPINLRLRGSYKQLAVFLYGLSKLNRIIRVQEMKITGPINSSSGLVMTETDLKIATYRIVGGS